ncbi:MAG: 16S rRNA (adenine(1518)-N(6)/adenine(1519)-N(6))-dimethyltransferase RsmA [Clostridia bacterium]|nr:16S rRNA (adenine(1518)-N(6)/adenine(1519)-N(6))-dimethyltransferase RsmA [Clostridia bacterium]
MYELTNIETIRRLLAGRDFNFSKALGQNFLTDPAVCPEMARLCGVTDKDGALEIGPGVGVLTVELAKRAKKVVAAEVDARLLPVLAKTLADCPNVEVLNADIIKTNLPALCAKHFADCENICVCANLPYYITSPVIMLLLECSVKFRAVTLMVQKEAAERVCAEVGGKNCGALTAAVHYYAETEYLFDVGRTSFLPPPNVDSAVIRLTPREAPPVRVKDEKLFFRVIKSAFAQRRKTAANSLAAGLGKSKTEIIDILAELGIPETARAETFSLETFAAIADKY